ncbi:multiple sugar transport system substrate-binding protein [Aminobacter lissarensis]|uniref:Multiple sugar transport system substrate-binding protein n=1 Tax=Aminobacter carboxidus TaxID=376165 RepID=A0A8E2BFR7_9HYPH|nr:sugar ABC transporter substrate-binding protein [Aminobacter lissarensis]MBB6469824.1 multiple sugar transport system substrate-binding protein [Aminobacter lissarensis]
MLTSIRRTLGAASLAAILAATAMPATSYAETLKFVSWQKDEKGVGDWWASVIKAWEAKHPGNTIEWTKVERGAYSDTMTTLFAGGTPPDIVHLASFEFQSFANNGWLEDLGPWVAKAGLNLDGWSGQNTCQLQGTTVCIMMLYYGTIFGYNDKILKEAGVSVPTNYAEFLAAAKATTKDLNGDGILDQFGTGHETKGGGGQYLAEMASYIFDAGARFTNAEGQVTIDTPEMIEGLTRWKAVVKDNLTPRDLSAGEVRKLFADGKIALKVDGPWLYPIMEGGAAKADLKLATVPFTPPLGGSSNVLAMPSEISDEKKQLVWDFIAIATSDQFQTSFATLATSTPPSPRADLTEAKAKIPHFNLLVASQQAAAKNKIDRIPVGLEVQFNEFSKMVQEEAQRMIIEDLDPAAVAKTMQEKAEAMK